MCVWGHGFVVASYEAGGILLDAFKLVTVILVVLVPHQGGKLTQARSAKLRQIGYHSVILYLWSGYRSASSLKLLIECLKVESKRPAIMLALRTFQTCKNFCEKTLILSEKRPTNVRHRTPF